MLKKTEGFLGVSSSVVGNERDMMAKVCCMSKEFGPMHFDDKAREVYFAKDDLLASLVEAEDPAFYEFEHPMRGAVLRVTRDLTVVQVRRWSTIVEAFGMFAIDEGEVS